MHTHPMTHGAFLGLLEAVFSVNAEGEGEIPFPFKIPEPLIWPIVGKVKLPSARALWMLNYSLKEKLIKASEQHMALHDTPEHTRKQCQEHHRQMTFWMNQSELIEALFWEMARWELPELLTAGGLAINESWEISRKPDGELKPFVSQLGHQACLTMMQLTQIMRSGATDTFEAVTQKVFPALEKGEIEITTITDNRIKKIWLLAEELSQRANLCKIEALRHLADKLAGVVGSPLEGRTMLQQLEGDIEKIEVEATTLERQASILRDLVWGILRDTHISPLDKRSDSIALRADWKLVSCPPEESDLGLAMIQMIEVGRPGFMERLRRKMGAD
jgi:hypothetical protein